MPHSFSNSNLKEKAKPKTSHQTAITTLHAYVQLTGFQSIETNEPIRYIRTPEIKKPSSLVSEVLLGFSEGYHQCPVGNASSVVLG